MCSSLSNPTGSASSGTSSKTTSSRWVLAWHCLASCPVLLCMPACLHMTALAPADDTVLAPALDVPGLVLKPLLQLQPQGSCQPKHMQVVALLAMEPPVSLHPDDIRDEKVWDGMPTS